MLLSIGLRHASLQPFGILRLLVMQAMTAQAIGFRRAHIFTFKPVC